MTRFAFTLFLLSLLTTAYGQVRTDDYLTLTGRTGKTLDPGSSDETYYITIGLVGNESRYYTACQMDIVFPDGVEPVYQGNNPRVALRSVDNGLFPSTKPIIDYDDDDEPIYGSPVYTHVAEYNYLTRQDGKRVLRIGIRSSLNEDFAKYSGDVVRFWVKASGYAKPSDNAFKLEGVKLITQAEIGYVPNVEMKGVVITNNATAPFNVSGTNHWSTCILPFATEIPSGVKAYTSSEHESENIILRQAESIEAYSPYILYSESGYSGTVSGTVDANNYPESGIVTVGNLTGAIVPQTVTEGFIMQKHDNKVQFYAIAAGDQFLVPAGKCWMNIASDNTKAFNFLIEEDETAIRSLTADSSPWRGEIYNLAGQRMSQMQKGINIVDGKKFILTK